MSKWDQLDSYLKQLERRVRLSALLRGAALVAAAALATTVILVFITNAFAFSQGSLSGARVALFLALAVAAGFGLAIGATEGVASAFTAAMIFARKASGG